MGHRFLSVVFAIAASGQILSCARRDAQTLERHQSLSSTGPVPAVSPLPMVSPTVSVSPVLAPGVASTNLRDVSIPANDEVHAVTDIDGGSMPAQVLARPGVCHVLAIGDSLTDPRSNGGGYLKAWRSRCPKCSFTNIGRGGAMVNQMLTQLRRHLLESEDKYSHFIVFGGVNDLYSDLTAKRNTSKIERDLETIYALGHQHGSLVISITVSPWGGFRRWYTEERGSNTIKLNNWIAQQRKIGKVDFVVDSGAVLSCGDPMLLCPNVMKPFRDGLHFGQEGHRRLGESILDSLDGAACGNAVNR
jgi:lysophospholipase L1-like esterase